MGDKKLVGEGGQKMKHTGHLPGYKNMYFNKKSLFPVAQTIKISKGFVY
jgi:hypothetical protein